MRPGFVTQAIAVGLLVSTASGTDYYVSGSGRDTNRGLSRSDAWKTLQRAIRTLRPGDTVHVLPGRYAGFDLRMSGKPAAPIRFLAENGDAGPNPAVVIDRNNGMTRDRINLEGASHIVIEGFTVIGSGDKKTNRACIRVVGSKRVMARSVKLRNNRCDRGGERGIFTAFVDDVLIEFNETSNAASKDGISVSNSGDRPIVRGNLTFGNHVSGIQMNGDRSQGGDGVISNALIERNVVFGNGKGKGSAINCDGVERSVLRNNLLFDNHAGGISLYRINGGGPSVGNLVINNTVWNTATGKGARWALNIRQGPRTTVRNNVLFNSDTKVGAIEIAIDSLDGFVSDHNVVEDRFSINGRLISFEEWRSYGQDASSRIATPRATFANAALFDLQLKAGSPAVDAGSRLLAPKTDLLGKARPARSGVDAGAYEFGASRGSAVAYGSPLRGKDGNPRIALIKGCAEAGKAFSVACTSSLPTPSPGFVIVGHNRANRYFLGGRLWVMPPLHVVPIVGSTVLRLTAPNSRGAVVNFQVFFVDKAALQGVSMSAGLELKLG